MQLKHQSLREEVYSPFLPELLDYELDDRVLVHLDGFKINPTYNTVGLSNLLPAYAGQAVTIFARPND